MVNSPAVVKACIWHLQVIFRAGKAASCGSYVLITFAQISHSPFGLDQKRLPLRMQLSEVLCHGIQFCLGGLHVTTHSVRLIAYDFQPRVSNLHASICMLGTTQIFVQCDMATASKPMTHCCYRDKPCA